MPEIKLTGCAPEPLMAYLKALAILRLVSEQKDAQARGWWQGDVFCLQSSLDEKGLCQFFGEEYQPSPIVAPWNGGSGFYPNDNSQALLQILNTNQTRFDRYKTSIRFAQYLLSKMKITDKLHKNQKYSILSVIRSEGPDELVRWMDTVCVLTSDRETFPPLLGTGGNDGRLEFTNNFMQRICDVLLHNLPRSKDLLLHALFNHKNIPLETISIGQYNPSGIGGANSTQGFSSGSLANSWDYVLMIEGALLYSGAVARRYSVEQFEKTAFPFTVSSSSCGYATVPGYSEAGDEPRGEIWLPIWNKKTTFHEISQLFSEGRVILGRKQVKNGVDFSRAIALLSLDRGITQFRRTAFLKRNGLAYIASPLGTLRVGKQDHIDLLSSFDPWLERFRQICKKDTTPERYRRVLRGIESAVFEYCKFGGTVRMQNVLIALGKAEHECAIGRGNVKENIRPLQGLAPQWLFACDDGSAEFRIATALASINPGEKLPCFRAFLEPVEWNTKQHFGWKENSSTAVWGAGLFHDNLAAVLRRLYLESYRIGTDLPPNQARFSVSLMDVEKFLHKQTHDQRIEGLLWGLSLLNWKSKNVPSLKKLKSNQCIYIPRLYALLKLLFLPDSENELSWGDSKPILIKSEPAVLNYLQGGRYLDAAKLANRRLRSSGLIPMSTELDAGEFGPRIAAALLIPIWQTYKIAKMVLRPKVNNG